MIGVHSASLAQPNYVGNGTAFSAEPYFMIAKMNIAMTYPCKHRSSANVLFRHGDKQRTKPGRMPRRQKYIGRGDVLQPEFQATNNSACPICMCSGSHHCRLSNKNYVHRLQVKVVVNVSSGTYTMMADFSFGISPQ